MKPKTLTIVRLALVFILTIACLPTISSADTQITLEWDATIPAPEGYRIYQRAVGEAYNYNQYIDVGPSTTKTVYGLAENTTYCFVVRAYDGGDLGGISNEVAYNSDGSAGTYDANPPSRPYTIAPRDNAQDVSLKPRLESSNFYDPDTSDYHTESRWQIYRMDNDALVLDLKSSSSLTRLNVPSNVLEQFTAYYWTVSYTNQKGATSQLAPLSYFTTEQTAGNPSSNLSNDSGGSSGGGGGGGAAGCLIQTLFQ